MHTNVISCVYLLRYFHSIIDQFVSAAPPPLFDSNLHYDGVPLTNVICTVSDCLRRQLCWNVIKPPFSPQCVVVLELFGLRFKLSCETFSVLEETKLIVTRTRLLLFLSKEMLDNLQARTFRTKPGEFTKGKDSFAENFELFLKLHGSYMVYREL